MYDILKGLVTKNQTIKKLSLDVFLQLFKIQTSNFADFLHQHLFLYFTTFFMYYAQIFITLKYYSRCLVANSNCIKLHQIKKMFITVKFREKYEKTSKDFYVFFVFSMGIHNQNIIQVLL